MEQRPSAAIGLMLSIAAHGVGWPSPEGERTALVRCNGTVFFSLGGTIRTGAHIHHLSEVETHGPVLFDTAPNGMAKICGTELPDRYRAALAKFRHGPGVFKVDWALSEPIPWSDATVAHAGTVHLGTLDEIRRSERLTWQGNIPHVRMCCWHNQPSLIHLGHHRERILRGPIVTCRMGPKWIVLKRLKTKSNVQRRDFER